MILSPSLDVNLTVLLPLWRTSYMLFVLNTAGIQRWATGTKRKYWSFINNMQLQSKYQCRYIKNIYKKVDNSKSFKVVGDGENQEHSSQRKCPFTITFCLSVCLSSHSSFLLMYNGFCKGYENGMQWDTLYPNLGFSWDTTKRLYILKIIIFWKEPVSY